VRNAATFISLEFFGEPCTILSVENVSLVNTFASSISFLSCGSKHTVYVWSILHCCRCLRIYKIEEEDD
jgi:hypothetical protein